MFPSLSLKYAKAPTVGTSVLGVTVLPPPASTFFKASSIESTWIVMTGVLASDDRP